MSMTVVDVSHFPYNLGVFGMASHVASRFCRHDSIPTPGIWIRGVGNKVFVAVANVWELLEHPF